MPRNATRREHTLTTALLTTLAAYCAAIFAASLLGGGLPGLLRLTHTRIQLMMSFVAGLMLGVAVYRLLPHSLGQLEGSVDTAVLWVSLGMVTMLLMLRLFRFHQHDFHHSDFHQHNPEQLSTPGPVDLPGQEVPPLSGKPWSGKPWSGKPWSRKPLSWVGVALGQTLHAVIDGMALGAALKLGSLHGDAAWAGLGVFLAILLHKPLDALSITSLLWAGNWSRQLRRAVNIGFATLCPLSAVAFLWGLGQFGDSQTMLVGCALAFAAGVFLCIALGDLLPEVQFHSHDRIKLTLSLLAGIGLAYVLRYLEPNLLHTAGTLP